MGVQTKAMKALRLDEARKRLKASIEDLTLSEDGDELFAVSVRPPSLETIDVAPLTVLPRGRFFLR
jgi:hypothetical protein